MRARVVNPKWIAGVMRHGYKGAFEIAATVDYLFAFAATAHAVRRPPFRRRLFAPISKTTEVRQFMAEHNPAALAEIKARFAEAIERGLWTPRRNSTADAVAPMSDAPESEDEINARHAEKMAKSARPRATRFWPPRRRSAAC